MGWATYSKNVCMTTNNLDSEKNIPECHLLSILSPTSLNSQHSRKNSQQSIHFYFSFTPQTSESDFTLSPQKSLYSSLPQISQLPNPMGILVIIFNVVTFGIADQPLLKISHPD